MSYDVQQMPFDLLISDVDSSSTTSEDVRINDSVCSYAHIMFVVHC